MITFYIEIFWKFDSFFANFGSCKIWEICFFFQTENFSNFPNCKFIKFIY